MKTLPIFLTATGFFVLTLIGTNGLMPRVLGVESADAQHYYQPQPPYQPIYPPIKPIRRYRSPFGPLPPRICSDPWTTPGLGLAGDNRPLRVCLL